MIDRMTDRVDNGDEFEEHVNAQIYTYRNNKINSGGFAHVNCILVNVTSTFHPLFFSHPNPPLRHFVSVSLDEAGDQYLPF